MTDKRISDIIPVKFLAFKHMIEEEDIATSDGVFYFRGMVEGINNHLFIIFSFSAFNIVFDSIFILVYALADDHKFIFINKVLHDETVKESIVAEVFAHIEDEIHSISCGSFEIQIGRASCRERG